MSLWLPIYCSIFYILQLYILLILQQLKLSLLLSFYQHNQLYMSNEFFKILGQLLCLTNYSCTSFLYVLQLVLRIAEILDYSMVWLMMLVYARCWFLFSFWCYFLCWCWFVFLAEICWLVTAVMSIFSAPSSSDLLRRLLLLHQLQLWLYLSHVFWMI